MKLDNELLDQFTKNFFGYGNLNSEIWFIGMEEGGGKNCDEINKRLDIWKRYGKLKTEDVAVYHDTLGHGNFFNGKIKNQPTWNKLIRLILSYFGRGCTLKDVKSFQKKEFGRKNSNNCLLELCKRSMNPIF